MGMIHWYADGRRQAVDSYDEDDFEWDEIAADVQKHGKWSADPIASLNEVITVVYDGWFEGEKIGTERGWVKRHGRELTKDERAADAYRLWSRGHKDAMIEIMKERVVTEIVEGPAARFDEDDDEEDPDDDDDDLDDEDDDSVDPDDEEDDLDDD